MRPPVTSFLALFLLLTFSLAAFDEVPATQLQFGEAAGFQRWPEVTTDNGTYFSPSGPITGRASR